MAIFVDVTTPSRIFLKDLWKGKDKEDGQKEDGCKTYMIGLILISIVLTESLEIDLHGDLFVIVLPESTLQIFFFLFFLVVAGPGHPALLVLET